MKTTTILIKVVADDRDLDITESDLDDLVSRSGQAIDYPTVQVVESSRTKTIETPGGTA